MGDLLLAPRLALAEVADAKDLCAGPARFLDPGFACPKTRVRLLFTDDAA